MDDRAAKIDRLTAKLTKQLADEGKLIEAGWTMFRETALAPDAPPEQIAALRMAFMAGAQHMWGSFFSVFDRGSKTTLQDHRRIDLIDAELNAFDEAQRPQIAARMHEAVIQQAFDRLRREELADPAPLLGDGPIEPQHVQRMTTLARLIDGHFNGPAPAVKKVGFHQKVFAFGSGGRANYMSNANREDVIVLLTEQLARFKGQPETRPGRA